MHKIIHTIFLSAAALPFVASAQDTTTFAQLPRARQEGPIRKGNMMLGANMLTAGAGIGSDGGDRPFVSYYSVGLHPRVGYFVTDHLAIGADLSTHVQGHSDYTELSLGGAVFARYYPGRPLKQNGEVRPFRFFLEAGVGAGNTQVWNRMDPGGSLRTQRFMNTSIYVMPGFSYALSRNVTLDLGLRYGKAYTDVFRGGQNRLGLNIGLQFYFLRRHKRTQL